MNKKHCPFLKEACKEAQCQLWIQVNDKNSNCAIAALPGKIEMSVDGIAHNIIALTRIAKP